MPRTGFRPGSEETFNWFAERIHAYMNMPPDTTFGEAQEDPVKEDMLTVLLLLRRLAHATREYRARSFDLMLDVFERVIHPIGPKNRDVDKDIHVMVCGHLNHHPEGYNERTRDLIKGALEKELRLWPQLPTSEEGCKRIERLLFAIQVVEDVEFLPLVQRVALPFGTSDGQFNLKDELRRGLSSDGSHARVILVALAHQAVTYLESLSGSPT